MKLAAFTHNGVEDARKPLVSWWLLIALMGT